MALPTPQRPRKTSKLKPLKFSALRAVCDPKKLKFKTTGDIDQLDEILGQTRALDALRVGTELKHSGYNLFVLGGNGTGRYSTVKSYLTKKAEEENAPSDWVYVHNFESAHHPLALQLPAGQANSFRDAMEDLIDDLRRTIPEVFNSDEYREKRRAIDTSFEEKQDLAFAELSEKAQKQEVAILRTPMGFGLAPTSNGQVLKPEVFNHFPKEQRAEVENKIAALQIDLTAVLEQLPLLQKDHRNEVKELNAELTGVIVDGSIKTIAEHFEGIDSIQRRISSVRRDLIDNTEVFLSEPSSDEEAILPESPMVQKRDPRYNRYRVNVIVANDSDGDAKGAPLVFEDHPTLSKLIGRIEHLSQYGALVTDFTMIRPGALHRANGGYLVLDVRKVLSEPFVWEALKRALRGHSVKIVSTADELGLTSTISLEPEPIPLDVKVVLIGERMFYYLICDLDPDFGDLFKIEVDFDDEIDRSEDNIKLYARLIATIAKGQKLKPLDASAVARVIEETARLAEDSQKLSLRVGLLTNILQEANYWAGVDDQKIIAALHIERALMEQYRRSNRIQQLSQESIERGTHLIDTKGAMIGQINGLSVLSLGKLSFGKPSRITARVRSGSGKVIDIERESKLGGPLHSKGVLILSGYLAAQFAQDVPLSLWASIVFEQSYGGIDGDSASSAELYALLSALSDVPIKQSFAVTGSVNQLGVIQPIGGVNEKIEGFFEICKARGLTGEQGVLIPASNVKHLMLKPEVVVAAKAKKFHIYPVETIEQGIELLTGLKAGVRQKNGRFPKNTINSLVEEKLHRFAELRKNSGIEKVGTKA